MATLRFAPRNWRCPLARATGALTVALCLAGAAVADEQQAAPTQAASPGATDAGGSATTRRTVVVAPGDTLVSIVERAGYAADLRLQALIAVYQANLQAFDGNAYRLLPGSTLRLPDEREVALVDQHIARQQVRQQYDGYRQDARDNEAPPAAIATQAAAQAAQVPPPATAGTPVPSPSGTPEAGAPRRAIRRLAAAAPQQDRELLRALEATLAELTARIATLTTSMTDLTTVIAQTDDKIAVLKATLQDLRAGPAESVSPQAAATLPPATSAVTSAAPMAPGARGQGKITPAGTMPGDHRGWASIDNLLIAALVVLSGGLIAIVFWKLRRRPVTRAPAPEPAAIA